MFHAQQMIDMAKSPEEVKEDIKEFSPPAATASAPKTPVYPYGLCLSFDEEILEKLGLGAELPAVGATTHFCAEAKVTSVSQNESEGSDGTKRTCQRVELQITRLGIPGASEGERSAEVSAARRATWYGDGDIDED